MDWPTKQEFQFGNWECQFKPETQFPKRGRLLKSSPTYGVHIYVFYHFAAGILPRPFVETTDHTNSVTNRLGLQQVIAQSVAVIK